MKNPVLFFYATKNGEMRAGVHEAYTRDIPAGDLQGLLDHLDVCPFCAARYNRQGVLIR